MLFHLASASARRMRRKNRQATCEVCTIAIVLGSGFRTKRFRNPDIAKICLTYKCKTYQYDSCNPGRDTIKNLVPNVAARGLEQYDGSRRGEDAKMNNIEPIRHPEKGTKSHVKAGGCLFNDWCGPIVRIKTSHNSGESESESAPMVANCMI